MTLKLRTSPVWFSEPKGGGVARFFCAFSPGVGRRAGIGSRCTWKLLTALQINEFLPGTTLAQEGAWMLSFSVLTNCSASGFDWLLTEILSVQNIKHSYGVRQGFGWGGTGWGPPCLPFSGGKLLREQMPCLHMANDQLISGFHVGLDGRQTAGLVTPVFMSRSSWSHSCYATRKF